MKLININPAELLPNPWNPNRLTPEGEMRLEESLLRGIFRPIVVRELIDGTLQVLGGWHRREAAIRLGMKEIPALNLGEEITDERAQEIIVLDNGRYGHDDADALSKLLAMIGTPADLAAYMPFDIAEITSLSRSSEIDLDDLGLGEDDEKPIEVSKAEKAPQTHETMRVRFQIEDAPLVREVIKTVIEAQGFEGPAEETAGQALLWILNQWSKEAGE